MISFKLKDNLNDYNFHLKIRLNTLKFSIKFNKFKFLKKYY